MGHRALVARERGDGRHDLFRSQWGGADLSLAHELDHGGWPPPRADRDPVATGVAWTDLLGDHLDPLLHEALYVARRQAPTAAYRPLWLGADPADPSGLLAAVDRADPCDDARVLAWFAGARAVARAACDRDLLSPAGAATLVEARLRAYRGDREVVQLP
jgi:hypothetical protein